MRGNALVIENRAAFASMVFSLLLIAFGISTVWGIFAMTPTLLLAEMAGEGNMGKVELDDGTGASMVTLLQFFITPRSSVISLIATGIYWIATIVLSIKGLRNEGHRWMAATGLTLAISAPLIIMVPALLSFSVLSRMYF